MVVWVQRACIALVLCPKVVPTLTKSWSASSQLECGLLGHQNGIKRKRLSNVRSLGILVCDNGLVIVRQAQAHVEVHPVQPPARQHVVRLSSCSWSSRFQKNAITSYSWRFLWDRHCRRRKTRNRVYRTEWSRLGSIPRRVIRCSSEPCRRRERDAAGP